MNNKIPITINGKEAFTFSDDGVIQIQNGKVQVAFPNSNKIYHMSPMRIDNLETYQVSNNVNQPRQKQNAKPIKQTEEQFLRDHGYVIDMRGKPFVRVPGLVALAHRKGVQKIETEIIMNDLEKKICVVKATVTGSTGTYTGIGDACPENCNKMVGLHYMRMAETRAIGRALRLFCNVGMCTIEEIND